MFMTVDSLAKEERTTIYKIFSTVIKNVEISTERDCSTVETTSDCHLMWKGLCGIL